MLVECIDSRTKSQHPMSDSQCVNWEETPQLSQVQCHTLRVETESQRTADTSPGTCTNSYQFIQQCGTACRHSSECFAVRQPLMTKVSSIVRQTISIFGFGVQGYLPL